MKVACFLQVLRNEIGRTEGCKLDTILAALDCSITPEDIGNKRIERFGQEHAYSKFRTWLPHFMHHETILAFKLQQVPEHDSNARYLTQIKIRHLRFPHNRGRVFLSLALSANPYFRWPEQAIKRHGPHYEPHAIMYPFVSLKHHFDCFITYLQFSVSSGPSSENSKKANDKTKVFRRR